VYLCVLQVRQMQLKEQMEKCRVLQESLHALASEHHELERSLLVRRSSSVKSLHDDEEFYDCDDVESYGMYRYAFLFLLSKTLFAAASYLIDASHKRNTKLQESLTTITKPLGSMTIIIIMLL
jgi:hypothetical protein